MKQLPNHDPVTGEWYYKGRWYDSFPSEEIETEEAAEDEYWERKPQRKREDK